VTVTPPPRRRRAAATAAALVALALPTTAALTAPAAAVPSTDSRVIIDEVYGGGGNSGAAYNQDFIELYNPTDAPVSLDGWSIQYASSGGTWANGSQTNLTGEIPAGGSFLVAQAVGSNTSLPALPAPDATGTIAMSGSGAKVALVSTTQRLSCTGTACATAADVVDLVGWGASANAFLGTGPAPGTTNATSVARVEHANTVDNAADFITGAPTPTSSGTAGEEPEPEPQPDVVAIAYPTGGFNGVYVQTAGTGGDPDADATPGASDAVFVYSAAATRELRIGDHVEVTGQVGEYFGLTQVSASSWTVLAEPATAVKPTTTTWPANDAAREALEGMLLAPQGDFTVTDNYDTNFYGTIGLAAGTSPLVQPTTVGRPGSAEAAAQAADNAARAVLLDDEL
jgi:predicted extracellular nuclease